jgi:hypothetical protein
MKTTFKSHKTMLKAITLAAFVMVSLSANVLAYDGAASEVKSVNRPVGNFYGVVINTTANVILSQGETASVRIEGRGKDIEKTEASIVNGSLVISGSNNVPVTIYITVEELNRVEVNSTARIYASGIINSDILMLKVNGNGSIRMEVRALSLGMIVKGKGKIMVSGSAGESYSRIFDGGRIVASSLDTFASRTEINSVHTSVIRQTEKSGKRLTLKLTN